MKAVLAILPILSLVKSQFVFQESIWEILIANLEQSGALISNDCLGQLKLLNAMARDKKPTCASRSKFQ